MSQSPEDDLREHDLYGEGFRAIVLQDVRSKLRIYTTIRSQRNRTVVMSTKGRKLMWATYIVNAEVVVKPAVPLPENYLRTEMGYHELIIDINQVLMETLPNVVFTGGTRDKPITATVCNLGNTSFPSINLIFSDDIPKINASVEFDNRHVVQVRDDSKFKVLHLLKFVKPAKKLKVEVRETIMELSEGSSEENDATEDKELELLEPEDYRRESLKILEYLKARSDKRESLQLSTFGSGQVTVPTEPILPSPDIDEGSCLPILPSPAAEGSCLGSFVKLLTPTKTKKDELDESVGSGDYYKVVPSTVQTNETLLSPATEGSCLKSFAKLMTPQKTKRDEREKSVEPDDVSKAKPVTTQPNRKLYMAVDRFMAAGSPSRRTETNLPLQPDNVPEARLSITQSEQNLPSGAERSRSPSPKIIISQASESDDVSEAGPSSTPAKRPKLEDEDKEVQD